MPDLLFVTTDVALDRLAPGEAAALAEMVPESRLRKLPPGTATAEAAMEEVRPFLEPSEIEGVVLLGDYDQVPSRAVRAIDDDLRACLGTDFENEQDHFWVWNDDIYGDRNGDAFGLPELPVSRVSSGPVARLLATANGLAPADAPVPSVDELITAPAPWAGIRGSEHPFAQVVLDKLGAGIRMLDSPDHVTSPPDPSAFNAEHLYIVLHCEPGFASIYTGQREDEPGGSQAMVVSSVPPCFGAVVFAACCWGALVVDETAKQGRNDPMVHPRHAGNSIALNFVEKGARAFVGFTALTYGSTDHHIDYFGAPLHSLFWRKLLDGAPPAKALFEAKVEYIRGTPRRVPQEVSGKSSPLCLAIEMKTYWSATCLGLGW